MELDALLLRVGDDAPQAQPQPRNKLKKQLEPKKRMRRMDVACLAVVGLVACIITARQPQLREDNPLWRPARRSGGDGGLEAIGFVTLADVAAKKEVEVEMTPRAVRVGGRKTLLIGAELPYAEVEVTEWQPMVQQAKSDGSNVVVVDVTWETHEPLPGVFHLADNADLTRLYEVVAREGMFAHARFSPRGCGSSGNDVEEWKATTERFVNVMLAVSRPFLAMNGGPIITTELATDGCNDVEGDYSVWTEQLLQRLDTKTLWISGDLDAVAAMIPACKSSYDCEHFVASLESKYPLVWTRAAASSKLSAQELAFDVARWFAMGGTVFSDLKSLEMIPEEDLSDARAKMAKLRHTLAKCSEALVSNEVVVEDVDYSSLIPTLQRAFMYGDQIAFLENPANDFARVAFRGAFVDLAAQSVVITNGTSVLFNSSADFVAPATTTITLEQPTSNESIVAVGR